MSLVKVYSSVITLTTVYLSPVNGTILRPTLYSWRNDQHGCQSESFWFSLWFPLSNVLLKFATICKTVPSLLYNKCDWPLQLKNFFFSL